VNGTPWMR